jgi:hypothetical protein
VANIRHRDGARAQDKALETRSARRKAKTNRLVPEDCDASPATEPDVVVQLPRVQPVTHNPFVIALRGLSLDNDEEAHISEAAS